MCERDSNDDILRDNELTRRRFGAMGLAAGLAALDPENHQALLTLQEGMRDKLDFVRSLSAWHLGRLGLDLTGLEAVLPGLRELLNDRDPNTRREAALALKKCRCPAASPPELSLMPRVPPNTYVTE